MDFRAAYLPDKYWHRRSVVVPSEPMALDDRFKPINDIFLNEEDRNTFEIFWVEKDVMGNVRLAGEFNYAYYEGRFYHLEKVNNQGFILNGGHEDNVWSYYMEYDDWQNDWLRDRVEIMGTISKTGDWQLARAHMVQLAPLVQGCSNFKNLTSKLFEDYRAPDIMDNFKLFEKIPFYFHFYDPEKLVEFDRLLNDFNYNDPIDTDKLVMPLLIEPGVISESTHIGFFPLIKDYLKNAEQLTVYDVKKTNLNFAYFKTRYQLDGVYAISAKGHTIYEVAETENLTVRLKPKLDFSGLRDVRYLNTDLRPVDVTFEKMETYWNKLLQRYPNVTSDADKANFKFWVFHEYFRLFKRFYLTTHLEDAPITRIHKNLIPQRTENDLGIWKYLLPRREVSRNFLYPVGTPLEYLISYTFPQTDAQLDSTYTINGITKTIREWLDGPINDYVLYYKESIEGFKSGLSEFPRSLTAKFPGRFSGYSLSSDSTLPNFFKESYGENHKVTKGIFGKIPTHTFKLNNLDITLGVCLLPDYVNNSYVLGSLYSSTWTNKVSSEWVNFAFKQDPWLFPNELTTNVEVTNDWKTPNSDLFLGFDGNSRLRNCERFAFIFPMVARWSDGWNYARNYNKENFAYWFSRARVRTTTNEAGKRVAECVTSYFQFPLHGCGFDITKILEKYKGESRHVIKWNYICTDEYKRAHNLVDKGGNFSGYWGIINEGQPKAMQDLTKANHPCINNCVEIRLCYRNSEERTKSSKIMMELWALTVFRPWDSSANTHKRGVIPVRNGGHDKDGYLGIDFARPCGGRWYMCGLFICNSETKSQQEGNLMSYGGSTRWDRTKQVWIIPYSGPAYSAVKKNVDIWPVLHCFWWYFYLGEIQGAAMNAEEINWEISSYEKIIRSIQESEKPWELFTVSSERNDIAGNVRRLSTMLEGKTYKVKRNFNPRTIFPLNFKEMDPINRGSQYEYSDECGYAFLNPLCSTYRDFQIPLYIWNFINPDNVTSRFKNHRYVGNNWKEDLITNLDYDFEHAFRLLDQTPFVLDLVGTEFIVFAKVTSSGEWQFELVSKTNGCYEREGTKLHRFGNLTPAQDTEESFIQRVNSTFEVVVYGQRIPIKTRPDMTLEEIDIGLSITPISDSKQTTSSTWYLVEIRADQDTQRTRIEVPKEMNNMNITSPYEREDLLRTMAYHAKDRQIENMQFQDERAKYSFDMDLKGQRIDINRSREVTNEIIGMAQTTLQTAQAVGYGMSGWNPAGWASGAMAAASGAASLAGQATNMAFSKQLHQLNVQEHQFHAAHGARALEYRGDLMANKHELAQRADRMAIYNMQNNVQYPANSDSLIYKEENKQFGLTDIYLTQYYPDGRQLDFLVNYYKEYGFNLVVPNQRCFGISWIRGHIQFAKIISNVHENETIRRMIEERALAGVTLSNNRDWHADEVNDHREHFVRVSPPQP